MERKLKKYLILLCALFLLVGCGATQEETESETTEATLPEENLTIGEIANFDSYTVTLEDVRVEGENLIARLNIVPTQDQEFSTNFVFAQDAEGNLESSLTEETTTMPAGQPFTTEVSFTNNDLNRIIWMDEDKEAAWGFEPISSVQIEQAPAETETTEEAPAE